MKKLTCICICITMSIANLCAQSVGVGTQSPSSSAALDITSTSKGMLMPRMTTAQRNVIVNPATGLMILNLDDKCVDVYDGENWIKNCGMQLTGTDTITASWVQKASLGSGSRFGAVSFSIDGMGYMGTGFGSNSVPTNDFRRYNPENNTWTQMANVPGLARALAIGFASAENGYVGTGTSVSFSTPILPLRDMWRYNPDQNQWYPLPDLPGASRANAVCFSLNGDWYIGTGQNSVTPFQDLHRFDTDINFFTGGTNFPFVAHSMCAFEVNGTAYVGNGVMNLISSSSIYAFNGTTWVQVTAYPGGADKNAIAANVGVQGFMGTGGAIIDGSAEFYAYTPSTNTWTQLADCSNTGRTLATSFVIDGKIYVFGGMNSSAKNDLWEFEAYPQGNVYELGYDTPGPIASISDGIWTTYEDALYPVQSDKNGIVLLENGNVGIGTDQAFAPLQFKQEYRNRKMVLWQDIDGSDHKFIGLGANAGSLRYQVDANSSSHIFYSASNNLASSELMRIAGTGNVGIGNATPHAPLHIYNGHDTRKIALFELVDNDHQFSGFGTGALALRYQVADSTFSHIFYRGINVNTSAEIMRIQGTGQVGIGTATPHAPLQLANASANRKIVLFENQNNDHQFTGWGTATGSLLYQVDATSSDHVFRAGAGISSSNELLRITGTGHVGIDNATPYAPLHFKNALATRKIVLFGPNNNNFQFYGFGIDDSMLRYQVDATSASHVFFAGNGSGDDNELLRITGSGNVGINNTAPHAPLHFNNSAANRKIVISEAVNNDHQFNGFGLNPGGFLRYQVEGTGSAHLFYAATSASGSSEVFRINGNGKVGIAGMMTPNGLLQFPNAGNYRKMVLFESANNDHQFMGMGTQTNVLNYQVEATSSSHVFSTGLTSSTSDELLRITGTGNVGIDNATPFAPLHFKNAVATRKIVMFGQNNNDFQFYGFGVDNSTLRYQVDAITASHVFFAGNGVSDDNELLRITGGGNVGINNAAPHAPLQFSNDQVARKIVLHETVNNDNEFSGLGLVGTNMRYQVASTSMDHMFLAATSNSGSNVLMRVKGNGNMTLQGIIETSAWIPVTFQNSFDNLGGDFATAAYYKDKMGIVRLRGTVEKPGTPQGFVIFTLPEGYRPSTSGKLVFAAMNGAGIARVDITASGNVEVTFGSAGTIHLDGIAFRAD